MPHPSDLDAFLFEEDPANGDSHPETVSIEVEPASGGSGTAQPSPGEPARQPAPEPGAAPAPAGEPAPT